MMNLLTISQEYNKIIQYSIIQLQNISEKEFILQKYISHYKIIIIYDGNEIKISSFYEHTIYFKLVKYNTLNNSFSIKFSKLP